MWAAGNGTAADDSALLRWGICRVTTDVTLSTSATTFCNFSNLPNVAKSWALTCDVSWSVTAGTTPTIAFGVNPSQTPTGATNITGEIKTTNTNTATENTVSLSASGALNIITSPTLTTAATIFSGHIYGTVLASATAGSFAVTATGTGTSFAGVVRAGTVCELR